MLHVTMDNIKTATAQIVHAVIRLTNIFPIVSNHKDRWAGEHTCPVDTQPTHYCGLKASIGSVREAFQAGNSPATIDRETEIIHTVAISDAR